jgi:hypothetical protein
MCKFPESVNNQNQTVSFPKKHEGRSLPIKSLGFKTSSRHYWGWFLELRRQLIRRAVGILIEIENDRLIQSLPKFDLGRISRQYS